MQLADGALAAASLELGDREHAVQHLGAPPFALAVRHRQGQELPQTDVAVVDAERVEVEPRVGHADQIVVAVAQQDQVADQPRALQAALEVLAEQRPEAVTAAEAAADVGDVVHLQLAVVTAPPARLLEPAAFVDAFGDLLAGLVFLGSRPGGERSRRSAEREGEGEEGRTDSLLVHGGPSWRPVDAVGRGAPLACRPVSAPGLQFADEDPGSPDALALLERHLAFARQTTPPDHVHALDLVGLRQAAVTFCGAREQGRLLAVGGLKQLDATHAEIKSMHTAAEARGRGVGAAMVAHLLELARQRGYRRVSLETGTAPAFAAARRLYERAGFVPCEPFAAYTRNPFSVCMTREVGG